MSESSAKLSDYLSASAQQLISDVGGDVIIQRMGMDVIREVIYDILTGKNLRDSTEVLTRRRITALNLGILNLFLTGSAASQTFIEQLPYLATNILESKRISKTEKWLAQWVLGLTGKSIQNVLKDDFSQLIEYRDNYVAACKEIIAQHELEYGILKGNLETAAHSQVQIDWAFMTYLMNTIGSQTLTIRGSEKSAYGKLFEKLILGSLLSLLDFQFVPYEQLQKPEKVFWLSSRGSKRESDATLLYEAGKGIRFDIGFIGRGNSEISLDKVSRFEREIEINQHNWFMSTIILVDQIPARSRIIEMAKALGAIIIQMSGSYWPQSVASHLNQVLGFEHKILHLSQLDMGPYIRQKLNEVPINDFIQISKPVKARQVKK